MGRSRSGAAPGRTVTLAGFLLGTVSGSGVATTVMLGSVSWPLLRKAGYRPAVGGAILSAAGIGAMTDARWADFFKTINVAGAYPTDLDLKKAYTLQFVTPKAK